MSESDQLIWDKFRKGDKHAFNDIYYHHIQSLFNYGAKFTNDHVLVEEVIQELFTDLWVKRDRLSTTSHIKPYLFKALKRRILRQLSKEKRTIALPENEAFELTYAVLNEQINENEATIMQEKLNKLLDQLTARQKEAIFLKYYERLSFHEIAEILQIEVKATYKLVARALERLKNISLLLLVILQKFSF